MSNLKFPWHSRLVPAKRSEKEKGRSMWWWVLPLSSGSSFSRSLTSPPQHPLPCYFRWDREINVLFFITIQSDRESNRDSIYMLYLLSCMSDCSRIWALSEQRGSTGNLGRRKGDGTIRSTTWYRIWPMLELLMCGFLHHLNPPIQKVYRRALAPNNNKSLSFLLQLRLPAV